MVAVGVCMSIHGTLEMPQAENAAVAFRTLFFSPRLTGLQMGWLHAPAVYLKEGACWVPPPANSDSNLKLTLFLRKSTHT